MLFEMKISRFILKIPEHHLIFLRLLLCTLFFFFFLTRVCLLSLAQINELTPIPFPPPRKS